MQAADGQVACGNSASESSTAWQLNVYHGLNRMQGSLQHLIDYVPSLPYMLKVILH